MLKTSPFWWLTCSPFTRYSLPAGPETLVSFETTQNLMPVYRDDGNQPLSENGRLPLCPVDGTLIMERLTSVTTSNALPSTSVPGETEYVGEIRAKGQLVPVGGTEGLMIWPQNSIYEPQQRDRS